MVVLAGLPVATFVMTRLGVSRIEAVGIAVFAALLVVGWRRGATAADDERSGAWAAGARGEESTAAVLDERPVADLAVWHDIRLPGRRENIDHLLIGRHGVTVIETKQWSGRVVVGRAIRLDGRRRDDVVDQVDRLCAAVERHLGGGAPVDAFVCIHGATVRAAWWRRRTTIGAITIGGPDDLRRWLRRRRRAVSVRTVAALTNRLETRLAR